MGKEVVTVFLHDDNLRINTFKDGQPHVADFGPVWRVRGKALVSNYGGVGDEVDCAQAWLEVIVDPADSKVTDTVKELENT